MVVEKELIHRNLKRYFKQHGKGKVVILPLRNLSSMVSDILKNEFDMQEQFIVDNITYDKKHVFPMNQMPDGYQDCTFLLAALGNTKKILYEQLKGYVREEQIVDLVFEEREKIYQSNAKVHLDFLCPGFAKCGTTSLHYALAQTPGVFLPSVKETHFLSQMVNETTHEAFKNQFREADTVGKLVGSIEPSYKNNSEDVYRYFGGDLKLIFCVRNPVDALYSLFKMEMSDNTMMIGTDSPAPEIMLGCERVTPELFDKWAAKYKFRYCYAGFIRAFLKFYSKEQMKILVSEELYVDADVQMGEVQEFLGIGKDERVKYSRFPRENVGGMVVKDQQSLEIVMSIRRLRHRLKHQGDEESLAMLQDIRERVKNFTMVDYNEPMLESTRRDLQDYYMDSIHELEDMLGRSLQGVWY